MAIDEKRLLTELEVWKKRAEQSEEEILIMLIKAVIDKVKAQPIIEVASDGK